MIGSSKSIQKRFEQFKSQSEQTKQLLKAYHDIPEDRWWLIGDHNGTKVATYELTALDEGFVVGSNSMLNTIVKASHVIQKPVDFSVLDLKSNMSHPQCKRAWDQSFQGHKFHSAVSEHSIYASGLIRGFWPVISKRSFHGVLSFDHNVKCCQSWAYSAVPYSQEALDLDKNESRIPSFVKLAAFKVEDFGKYIEIEIILQTDPVGVLSQFLLPFMARIIPIQISNLIQFTKTHGGPPLLFDLELEDSFDSQSIISRVTKDVQYNLKTQELILLFNQTSMDGILIFCFRIDDVKWLKAMEDSLLIYCQGFGCEAQFSCYFKHDNWFLKIELDVNSVNSLESRVVVRGYKFDEYHMAIRLQQMAASLPSDKISNIVSDKVSELKLLSQNIFSDFKQKYDQMILSQPVCNISGTNVYKLPVAGHPIGYVLGVAEYQSSDYSPPLSIQDLRQIISSAGCRKVWDDIFDYAVVLERLDAETKIVHSTTIPKWPTSARDVIACVHEIPVSVNEHVVIAFSVPKKFIPDHLQLPRQNYVRATLDMGVWRLQQIDGKIYIAYMAFTNPNGTIPKFLLEQVSKSFPSCVNRAVQCLLDYGVPPHFLSTEQYEVVDQLYDHKMNTFVGKVNLLKSSTVQICVDSFRWLQPNRQLIVETEHVGVIVKQLIPQEQKFNLILQLTAEGSGQLSVTIRQSNTLGSGILFNGVSISAGLSTTQAEITPVQSTTQQHATLNVDLNVDIAIKAHAAFRELVDIIELSEWKRAYCSSRAVKLYQSAGNKYVRITAVLSDLKGSLVMQTLLQDQSLWDIRCLSDTRRTILPDLYNVQSAFQAFDGVREIQSCQYVKKLTVRFRTSYRLASRSYVDDKSYFSAWLITQLADNQCKVQFLVADTVLEYWTLPQLVSQVEDFIAFVEHTRGRQTNAIVYVKPTMALQQLPLMKLFLVGVISFILGVWMTFKYNQHS